MFDPKATFEVCRLRQSMKKHQVLMLDLCCGAGGASKGYMRAGFVVVGIDIKPQPRYIGDLFFQGDALQCDYEFLGLFDFIHASPPCQQYSVGSIHARNKGKTYPDLIQPMRQLLVAAGKPYVMENVSPAPLRPDVCLDGTMFELGVIRRRVFETNIPDLPKYPKPSAIIGTIADGDYVTVAGNGGGIGSRKADWVKAMGIDWMRKYELKESIPPAYTHWLGLEILASRDFSEWDNCPFCHYRVSWRDIDCPNCDAGLGLG